MNCADKEISISFTDDENIKKLNEQYLGRNKPTNVLSFSLQEGEYGNINPQTLGDVVISVETAQQDAVQGKLTFEQEIDFLLIHGILHLLGYNHENSTAEETKKMKQKEKEIFNKISIKVLFFNDQTYDKIDLKNSFEATFTVPYTPGLLTAVGVVDNKEIETTILQTSGDASKIKLIPDRKKISANGQDLSFVTIEVTDKNGLLNPNAQNQLHFNIDGPGVIAGVDNASLKDLDSYVGTTRNAWHGRALVIVRSTKKTGDIKLTVSSPGLTEAKVNIRTDMK